MTSHRLKRVSTDHDRLLVLFLALLVDLLLFTPIHVTTLKSLLQILNSSNTIITALKLFEAHKLIRV